MLCTACLGRCSHRCRLESSQWSCRSCTACISSRMKRAAIYFPLARQLRFSTYTFASRKKSRSSKSQTYWMVRMRSRAASPMRSRSQKKVLTSRHSSAPRLTTCRHTLQSSTSRAWRRSTWCRSSYSASRCRSYCWHSFLLVWICDHVMSQLFPKTRALISMHSRFILMMWMRSRRV